MRRELSYAGLERLHNFEVTARILLYRDFMFCPTNDFNELHVAKDHALQPPRDLPLENA